MEACALRRRPFPTQILDRFGAWQSFARAGKSPSTLHSTSLTFLKVFCLDLNREESIELTTCFDFQASTMILMFLCLDICNPSPSRATNDPANLELIEQPFASMSGATYI